MKVLKIVALIYLFSLIGLLIVATQEKGCINSITVQSINIERPTGTLSIPSCYFDQDRLGTPVLGDQKIVQNLSKAVSSFEEFTRINRFFYKPNSLKISIREGSDLQVSNKEIVMSFDAAKNPEAVRRSLAKAWMLGFASAQVRADSFFQEVITDLFVYAFWNETQWQKEGNFKRWLKYVYSEKDICETSFSPESRISICGLLTDSDKAKSDQISFWSLRPLIVNRIVDLYDRMNYEQKSSFVRYMIGFALTTEEIPRMPSLTLKNFSAVYNERMNLILADMTGKSFDEQLSIDFVFELSGPQPYTMIKQKEDLPFYMTQNVLFRYDNNVFINLKNGSRFVSAENFVRHWVKVQDNFPSLKAVKHIPAEYLTILQAKQPYEIFEFFKKMDDLSAFPWPEEFDSLTIYVPSLKLLGRLAPKEFGTNQDIRNVMLNPKVEKILGWNPVQVY